MREEIREIIEQMGNEELVALNNEFCSYNNDPDSEIFEMSQINDMLGGCSHEEVLRMAYYGDFKICDDYFKFDGYGNLKSFDHPIDEIDIDEIVDCIIDNDEDFDNDEIRDILDEDEEEEDEEDEEEEDEEEEDEE